MKLYRTACTLALACALGTTVRAQMEDLAYVPAMAPARTADDATIGFRDRTEPGMVDLVLPTGTYHVDLLNAQGNVAGEVALINSAELDLRALKPGTWTVRAHCPGGLRVRRFVVLGRGGTMWVDQRRSR